jgi:hypothetical protein
MTNLIDEMPERIPNTDQTCKLALSHSHGRLVLPLEVPPLFGLPTLPDIEFSACSDQYQAPAGSKIPHPFIDWA